MEGHEINVSTETFQLPQPFFVVGTQNPLEMEGTFPLPEPEIDRFFFKVVIKGPSIEEIDAILERTTGMPRRSFASWPMASGSWEMRDIAANVVLAAPGLCWVASLVAATHPDFPQAPEAVKRYVRYGASPRAAQLLVLAAKVRAVANGRTEVAREDFAATRRSRPASPHPLELRRPGRKHPRRSRSSTAS